MFTQVIREAGAASGAGAAAAARRRPRVQGGRARASAPAFFADRTIDGTHVRVHVSRTPDGLALFRARPLTEVDNALGTLRWALGILALAGIALAVVLSRLATRTAIRPVAELTETAEHVATTRDLSRRIATQGEDEVSRLATSFNTMLEALERSQRAQRQLVADASHELRTPLTSLRTNLEVLARGGPPDPGDRDRLRADLVAQLEELTALVGDLVELARDDEPEAPQAEDVRLDQLVAAAVQRARRHAPARHVRDRARAGARAGRPGAAGPRGREPARQRREVEPAGRRRRRAPARRRADRARPRPGHPRGRARAGLRSLLPRRRRARAAGLRASGWRSCARSPRATAGRSRPRPPTAAARCCACVCRSSQQIPRFG